MKMRVNITVSLDENDLEQYHKAKSKQGHISNIDIFRLGVNTINNK